MDEKREQAKEASPTTYATRDDATFLIMHGTNDQVVPREQAEILHQALRQAKADSTFVKIIDGGHGFLCPAVSGRVSDFFAKHLLGQDVVVSAEPIAAPDAAARKELSRVIGTWKGPNTTIVWRRCIKNHCVAGSTVRDDGTQTYASLISIDPTSGGLIDHGISTWTNGEIHYTELSETQWRGKTRYIGNDGTVFTGDIVLEWNGTDEFKTTTTNRLINGIIPQDDIVSVFRRAPDEPELDNE